MKFCSCSCSITPISAPITLRLVIFINFFCVCSVFLMCTGKYVYNLFSFLSYKKCNVQHTLFCTLLYVVQLLCNVLLCEYSIVLFIYSPVLPYLQPVYFQPNEAQVNRDFSGPTAVPLIGIGTCILIS